MKTKKELHRLVGECIRRAGADPTPEKRVVQEWLDALPINGRVRANIAESARRHPSMSRPSAAKYYDWISDPTFTAGGVPEAPPAWRLP